MQEREEEALYLFRTTRITKWLQYFSAKIDVFNQFCVHKHRKVPCNCEGTEQLRTILVTAQPRMLQDVFVSEVERKSHKKRILGYAWDLEYENRGV